MVMFSLEVWSLGGQPWQSICIQAEFGGNMFLHTWISMAELPFLYTGIMDLPQVYTTH